MAEHTPGPWTIDDHALGIWAPSAKGGETKIFDIRGWGYLTGGGHGALGLTVEQAKGIQHANGRLASAAPELLAALLALRDYVEKGNLNDSACDDWLDRATAAIAKATGAA